MQIGDIVRPVVRIAGLDSRKLYRIASIEATPFYSLAYLTGPDGALSAPVENAHLVLEQVRTSTVQPCRAALN
jgi:hypothetical protein